MSKKYLVVGGVAGGMSAAARIRRLDPYADIQVFEKGPHVRTVVYHSTYLV